MLVLMNVGKAAPVSSLAVNPDTIAPVGCKELGKGKSTLSNKLSVSCCSGSNSIFIVVRADDPASYCPMNIFLISYTKILLCKLADVVRTVLIENFDVE
jgi:hypothetical protein